MARSLLDWKAHHLRELTGDQPYYAKHKIEQVSLAMRLRTVLQQPFVMARYEPVIILITLYLSSLYIVLVKIFDGYEYIFRQTYEISHGLSNTIFIGTGVGIVIGITTAP